MTPRRGLVKKYTTEQPVTLPPMGVTVYGRPQGGGSNSPASLELTVHHPG